jgi:hypothetical protein
MLFSITFFVDTLVAQSSPTSGIKVPLSTSYLNYFEAPLHRIGDSTHTSIKPFIPQDLKTVIDSAQETQILRGERFEQKWIGRKVANEDLIAVRGNNFAFFINPAVNFTIGKDNNWADEKPFVNTRGLRIVGNITPKFHFETEFYENQAIFPKYVHQYAADKAMIPGVGYTKNTANGIGKAYDYQQAMGGISYQPSKFFYFRLGHGKHFLGDGYRSLLMSDNSPAFPYFQIMTTFWKIRYMNIWSQMLDNTRLGADGTFARKYLSTHYLSYNITKRFNLSLFETVIYGDSIGTRGLDINYLNPIIFFRPIENQLNSNAGNILLGLNAKYKITNNQHIYGQFLLDEFNFEELRKKSGWWANKFGYQIGIKSFNTFIPNLSVQTEYNLARPYTYTHISPLQNYGNYGQPLAHPAGGNFKESVTTARYFYKRWFAEGRMIFINQGRDTFKANYGSDIYKPYTDRPSEYGVTLLQGTTTKITVFDVKTGFLINKSYNLRFELGATIRKFAPNKDIGNLKTNTTNYIYAGLKTDLNNFYYDF